MVSAHSQEEIPFPIQRMYYLYAVEEDRKSGHHANIQNQQVMVAVQGKFEVRLYDGKEEKIVLLNKAHEGLLVREGIWREVFNFSQNAICLVFCSEKYQEEDYIKDMGVFLQMKKSFQP